MLLVIFFSGWNFLFVDHLCPTGQAPKNESWYQTGKSEVCLGKLLGREATGIATTILPWHND